MSRALALLGFMASGKTTVGRLVAERAGCPFVDLDRAIEARAGRTVAAIFRDEGEARFRALEAAELAGVLGPGRVVALGGGTPIDDASWERLRRQALTVFLDVPLERLLERAAGGPPDAGDERPLLRDRTPEQVAALFQARMPRYRQADHAVDGDRPAAEVAEEVLVLWRG